MLETVDDWDESTFWEHYKYTPSEWAQIDLHDRAIMKARLILSNMVEIVDRYHETMAQKRRSKQGGKL